MAERMTKAAKRRRIQTQGCDECPYCREDIWEVAEFGELDPVECGDIEQKVKCTACGRTWIDVFRLIDVREIVS